MNQRIIPSNTNLFSETKAAYRWVKGQTTKPLIIDRTGHHIILGKQPLSFSTTMHHSQSNQTSIQFKSQKQRVTRAFVTESHIGLGSQGGKSSSVMKSSFLKHPFNQPPRPKSVKKQGIRIGCDPLNYTSTAKRDFIGQRSVTPQKFTSWGPNKTHFELGTNSIQLQSENKRNFTPKMKEQKPISKEYIQAQRKHNFQLGRESLTWMTSSSKQYSYPQSQTPQVVKGQKTKSSFNFGPNSTQWSSTYMKNFKLKSFTKPVFAKVWKGKSDVVLGVDPNQRQTTQNSTFKGEKGEIRESFKTKTSHTTLGLDSLSYTTLNMSYGKEGGSPSKQIPQMQRKMQETHWVSGNCPRSILPTYKQDYMKKQSAEVKKQIKNVHSLSKSPPGDYKTTYRGFFTWSKPN